MTPAATANIKHSPTPRHINVKPHTKGLFITSIPALHEIFKGGFQGEKKICRSEIWISVGKEIIKEGINDGKINILFILLIDLVDYYYLYKITTVTMY